VLFRANATPHFRPQREVDSGKLRVAADSPAPNLSASASGSSVRATIAPGTRRKPPPAAAASTPPP
jgi:hypothetical protein